MPHSVAVFGSAWRRVLGAWLQGHGYLPLEGAQRGEARIVFTRKAELSELQRWAGLPHPLDDVLWVVEQEVGDDVAIAAARLGVFDVVSLAVPDGFARLNRRLVALHARPPLVAPPPGMVAHSAASRRMFEELGRVARTSMPVLITGETGTGKEEAAHFVHHLSARKGPFLPINCAAIPNELMESELFGHVRGAFSGALKDEPGLVRSAQYGTLLLDEIGDLPASAQATLLRVLQENEVLPVGSTRPTQVDVRVIAATHRSLDDLIERGEFRHDLYARLAGYTFTLAPLRERLADLGLLVAALLSSGKLEARGGLRLHRKAARAMLRHDWPMNVRELEQCMRAASALAEDGLITAEDLPAAVAATLGMADLTDDDAPDAGDEELRRELLVRIADAKGNVSEVARAMGKARQQIQRWMRKFAIDPAAYRAR